MKALKTFFKPLQPTIGASYSGMVLYKEYKPYTALSEYVYCFWKLRSIRLLQNPFLYRVVSDGCIDILIDTKERRTFITGFSKQYVEYDLGRSFEYVGARFYPFMFPLLFGISAENVVNRFLNLEVVLPELDRNIKSRLEEKVNSDALLAMLSKVLSSYISKERSLYSLDPRFSKAVDQMLQSGGNIPINQLDLAVSQRQLRRFFQFYFGESPKVFSKVLRFQNILNAKPSQQSLTSEKVFYDKGYYDQAHFIRDFKKFYGVTPTEAFGR
nr:helix-turn-helix domain-containing protein [uncultured Allomuricauda sp.]